MIDEILREKYSKIYDTYNFISINDKNLWINKRIEYTLSIVNTSHYFIDIYKEVNARFNKQYDKMSNCEIDFIEYIFKEIALENGLNIEHIKSRYYSNFDEVEERMMFRIELYKVGWTIEQIEKYLYKKDYENFDKEKMSRIYHNFMTRREIERIELCKKIGRPSLPKSLKNYLKNKHHKKLKDIMNEKYIQLKEYSEKKKYFFTKNEVNLIKKVITDKEILDKVEHLQV